MLKRNLKVRIRPAEILSYRLRYSSIRAPFPRGEGIVPIPPPGSTAKSMQTKNPPRLSGNSF